MVCARSCGEVRHLRPGVAVLHATGRVEDAIDVLLDSFLRDRDWNEGAAKAQLLTIFDSLKPNDPLAQKGRRRLSSLIFA